MALSRLTGISKVQQSKEESSSYRLLREKFQLYENQAYVGDPIV